MIDIEKYIHDEAERLRKKMAGGLLFGEPVNLDNPDMILFMAYYLGKQEEGEKRSKEFFTLFDILSLRGHDA